LYVSKNYKTTISSIQRSPTIPDVVHGDICKMNGELTMDSKRYFITFIDNHYRFCYGHLLISKDKALDYKNNVELCRENLLSA